MKKKIEESAETAEVVEIAAEAVSDSVTTKADLPAEEKAGIFVYVGPSIRGVITNGSIRRGKKSEIFAALGERGENYPQIKRLLVSDSELARVREKLAKGEGAISAVYQALEKQIKEAK